MALIDDIEFYGRAVDAREMDRGQAVRLLVEASRGGLTARGVASLERQTLGGPFEGLVLRYGKLYGPGTGFDTPAAGGPLHVDAAADAARRAVTRGAPGVYNVAEEDGTVSSAKAARELGWHPDFRIRNPG